MRRPSLALVLTLALAVVLGAFPTHLCQPTCGVGGGVVFVGMHAHAGHDRGVCGHEHEAAPRAPDADDDRDACCEDDASAPVILARKADAPARERFAVARPWHVPACGALAPRADVRALAVHHPSGPPPLLDRLGTIVLLV